MYQPEPDPLRYRVQLEVAGPLAMFARPDTGGTPTSYPIPTWSAAKGLFESIAFFADGTAWICPVAIETCRRLGEPGGQTRLQRYTTNYGGPLRKDKLFKTGTASGGSSMQFFATVLSDVCFRLHGIVVGPASRGRVNARHYLKDLFERRLRQGRCFRTPCLGGASSRAPTGVLLGKG
jgi:CRISPR-associated protein Cas5d